MQVNHQSRSLKDSTEPVLPSLWTRATTPASQWPDKDEFLDVIYYLRQVLGVVLGLIWGLLPLKGVAGLATFVAINAGTLYVYSTNFQKVDEEEYGGALEMTKEGFLTSSAAFLVTWIGIYSALHFD